MRDVINFLKKAVDRLTPTRACYIFCGDAVYAQNEAFQAGAQLAAGYNMSMQADDIEKFFARAQGDPTISVADGVVTMRQGRLRATMRSMGDAFTARADIDTGDWQSVPPGFTAALGKAALFAGDHTFTRGIRLLPGRVSAINGRCGIDIAVDGLDVSGAVVLRADAAAYIGEYQPDYMQQRKDSVVFKWEDGRWLRVQFITEKFPATVDSLFDKAGTDAPCEITKEWRGAYEDAASFTDKYFTILHDRFIVERTGSMVEVAVPTAVPAGHSSKWSKEVLDLIVPLADAWNPIAYPELTLFTGDNLRGVCMGIK